LKRQLSCLRMASAMFTVRYSAKAKRGWITNSSASVDANAVADAQPKHYRVVWSKPAEPERELAAGSSCAMGGFCRYPIIAACRAMMLIGTMPTILSKVILPNGLR
jgi:hypothetical protein